jgi:hypothetical protein
MSEPETYPDGWDVSTGYYRGELRAEATREHDERVVCLDNTMDAWAVTAGHATRDPEHIRSFNERSQAADHFISVLDDTDAFVRQSQTDVSVGDVFKTEGGPIQVKGIQTDGDVRVVDPTASHPQNARANAWPIARSEFEERLAAGDIEPASIEVVE